MGTRKGSARIVAIALFLFVIVSLIPITTRAAGFAYDYQVLSGKHTISGVQRALIILVEFQDVQHARSASEIRTVAIDELNEYYEAVSQGRVSITGEVYGWFTINHSISYYGHDGRNPGDDNNVQALAGDALSFLSGNVDLTSFNFLIVVHSGQDQADDKPDVVSDEIWSACFCQVFPKYRAYRPISGPSKTFTNYALLSEFNGLGTFAHEWGHFFGLPDLYDTVSGDSYVGYWSLMDHGNWCCDNENQTTPSDIGAWGKALLGWLTPSVAWSSIVVSSFPINPLESSDPTALLIPISPATYYFVEYRTLAGVDSHLPESGILIYYVDESLNTGRGILKLEDPRTGNPIPGQQHAEDLNMATFQTGDDFIDSPNTVYIAFLGREPPVALYSKQELTRTILRTSLATISTPTASVYGDEVSISSSLRGESSALAGQVVDVEMFDEGLKQWQTVGSTVTGTQGEISLKVRMDFGVGDRRFRLLYPGGKIGNSWYSSTSTEFPMTIAPGKMEISVSFQRVIWADRVRIEVTATTVNGEPLNGVTMEIYVDNVRKGIAQTEPNGKASLDIPLGLGDVGWHNITAKTERENYQPAVISSSLLVVQPQWLFVGSLAAVAAVIALVAVRLWRKRKR